MPTNGPVEKPYTLAEAAELLQVSTRTIRRHIQTGALRAVVIGTTKRIPAADLRKAINGTQRRTK